MFKEELRKEEEKRPALKVAPAPVLYTPQEAFAAMSRGMRKLDSGGTHASAAQADLHLRIAASGQGVLQAHESYSASDLRVKLADAFASLLESVATGKRK